MTKAEMETYRQKLLNWGNRLRGDVAQLSDEALRKAGGEASGNLSNTPLHLADLGTDNFEEEMTLGLLENEKQIEAEIMAALNRIDQGSFGRCENCRQEIPKGRLDALPYTRDCVRCAQELEERGGQGGEPGPS